MPSEHDVVAYVLASWGTTNWELSTESWEPYLGWVETGGLLQLVFFPLHLPLFGAQTVDCLGLWWRRIARATQSHLNNFRKYLHSNILFSVLLFCSELLPVAPWCSSVWPELKALTYEALTWQAGSRRCSCSSCAVAAGSLGCSLCQLLALPQQSMALLQFPPLPLSGWHTKQRLKTTAADT